MSAPKPCCKSVYPWLRSNLGNILGALTHTDCYALNAAVHLAELWGNTRSDDVAKAFGLTVSEMQPNTRYFAFHAIAHVLDWGHRSELWLQAGLREGDKPAYECSFGPGGACVDLSKRKAGK